MPKYTEEQLFEIQEEAHNPQPEVLDAFNAMVEEVREHEKQLKQIKWSNGDTYIDENGHERPYHHLNRRRALRSGDKPNLRKKLVETVVGEDGWATTVKTRKLFGGAEEEERQKFRTGLKEVNAKPNNKNLGSLKAADPRDAIAEVQKKAFNAFDALGDESDDDEDDE